MYIYIYIYIYILLIFSPGDRLFVSVVACWSPRLGVGVRDWTGGSKNHCVILPRFCAGDGVRRAILSIC